MFPPSFGVKLLEVSSFISVMAPIFVGVLRNVFEELCNVEDTVTKIACVCWASTSAFISQQLV